MLVEGFHKKPKNKIKKGVDKETAKWYYN